MAKTHVKTRGTVLWYDPRKGYGYAARKNAPEVFLHYGAIVSDGVIELKKSQTIEFRIEQTPKGAVAHEIKVVK